MLMWSIRREAKIRDEARKRAQVRARARAEAEVDFAIARLRTGAREGWQPLKYTERPKGLEQHGTA